MQKRYSETGFCAHRGFFLRGTSEQNQQERRRVAGNDVRSSSKTGTE